MADDSERLRRWVAAEQDERRRIALFLHDGPVQHLAGIALMLDAALNSIDSGRYEDAKQIVTTALERHRNTIRELRDLSFSLEPVVLRDQGFEAAMRALAEQVGTSNSIRIDLDIAGADEFGETAQIALYTIVREVLELAIRRGPPTRIGVSLTRLPNGGVEASVADDADRERRRRSFEQIEDRVGQLHGTMRIDEPPEGGTRVVVTLPPYAAAR